ncbi:hypothetical protein DFH08DRAFT_836787 [Mycena albidolilacea]|uniref:Uncharacterized protein n=1 Tax=Mycena albidolilacea TaxID=1033008 RepID=A0AAD7ASJ8_9AGAR|nr:hypothetical protein DFH08DRAFT_836787 [Mycena albidolilacea]
MPACSCCRGQCTYPSSSSPSPSSSCTPSAPKKSTPSSGIPRSDGARECVRDAEEEWGREEEEAEGGGGGERYGSSVLSSSSSSSSSSSATSLSSPAALSSSTRSPTAPASAPGASNKVDPAPSAVARRGFSLSFSLPSAPTPSARKLDVRLGTIAGRTPANSRRLVFRPSAISCGGRRSGDSTAGSANECSSGVLGWSVNCAATSANSRSELSDDASEYASECASESWSSECNKSGSGRGGVGSAASNTPAGVSASAFAFRLISGGVCV